jgi:hypothetical protein
VSAADDVWSQFAHDPRDPAVAPLRASDLDREIIHRVLGEAFADGRLDREEYDERSASALGARTLGELPPIVSDLVPARGPSVPPRAELAAATPRGIQARAHQEWENRRRHAVLGFIGPTLICWAVWTATCFDDGDFDANFPWPLIVMAATLVNLIRTVVSRDEIIADEVRRLERKQAKQARSLKPRPGPGEGR